eukprot:CAMPEP_0181296096 /NCGR_PEP_ID=MMETSP1101-20121128/4510_1 /TAXON_ID=46948 /ORGANISM="Rhodomonas abbreviata, Strain Caron Lab Isolate" /LENGTH=400 /DNA_ID=CAMNT_0023400915 /DNA_START=218 /DNA_END=1420 /DNA_ORIENTATION=+
MSSFANHGGHSPTNGGILPKLSRRITLPPAMDSKLMMERRASQAGSEAFMISPTDWQGGRGVRRRSSIEPPPIGSPSATWGKYETFAEVLSRPQPPPPIRTPERKTLAKQGGRWSLYSPVTELYLVSRRSCESPGPGAYGENGAPDPPLSGHPNPFGKIEGGKFSASRRQTDVDSRISYTSKIPGPGEYDTDHIYGIYKQIRAGCADGQRPRPETRMSISNEFSMDTVGTASSFRTNASNPADFIAIEQSLVMSLKVPLQKHGRLGVTSYSRLRKDKYCPEIRKILHPPAPHTKHGFLSPNSRSPSPDRVAGGWGESSSIHPALEQQGSRRTLGGGGVIDPIGSKRWMEGNQSQKSVLGGVDNMQRQNPGTMSRMDTSPMLGGGGREREVQYFGAGTDHG